MVRISLFTNVWITLKCFELCELSLFLVTNSNNFSLLVRRWYYEVKETIWMEHILSDLVQIKFLLN